MSILLIPDPSNNARTGLTKSDITQIFVFKPRCEKYEKLLLQKITWEEEKVRGKRVAQKS